MTWAGVMTIVQSRFHLRFPFAISPIPLPPDQRLQTICRDPVFLITPRAPSYAPESTWMRSGSDQVCVLVVRVVSDRKEEQATELERGPVMSS